MNPSTERIAELLNRPELDFGVDPMDAEVMIQPDALRERVRALLLQPPIWITAEQGEQLRADAAAADWDAVAAEQRGRIQIADQFFSAGK